MLRQENQKENALPTTRAGGLKKASSLAVRPLGPAKGDLSAANKVIKGTTVNISKAQVTVISTDQNILKPAPVNPADKPFKKSAPAPLRARKPVEQSDRVTRSKSSQSKKSTLENNGPPKTQLANRQSSDSTNSTAVASHLNPRKRNANKEPKYAAELGSTATAQADQENRNSTLSSDAIIPKGDEDSILMAHDISARSKRIKLAADADLEVPELDEEDLEDPAMCADYVQEIMDYLMDREKFYMADANYIKQHPELRWNMRCILVDWIVEVHQKFKFLPETLFLAVNIMDRFLSRRVCSMNKFQLVGLASLFIAAKTEEIVCPSVSQFTFMSDNAFNDEDMLRAEQYILRVLDFNIWAPGPFSFLRRISKIDDYNVEHRTLAKYFCEIALLDHRFLSCPPSKIAAAAMYLSRAIHNAGEWAGLFVYTSGYKEEELLPIVDLMVEFLVKAPDNDSFFFKKYSNRRYGRAAQAAQLWASQMQQLPSAVKAAPSAIE